MFTPLDMKKPDMLRENLKMYLSNYTTEELEEAVKFIEKLIKERKE
jgi:hypothetical protein